MNPRVQLIGPRKAEKTARITALVMTPLVALAVTSCATPTTPIVEIREDPFFGVPYPSPYKPLEVPAAGLGIVTNSLSDTLSVLDLGTGQRLAELPVGRDPVAIDGPTRILIDEQASAAYVALTYPPLYGLPPHEEGPSEVLSPPGYVQRLDLRDLHITGEVRLDPGIGDIAFSRDGTKLIATNYDWDPEGIHQNPIDWVKALDIIDLTAFEPGSSAELRRIPLCISPNGMALSGVKESRVFAACRGDDTLAVVDLNDLKVSVKSIPAGDELGSPYLPNYGPFSVALSPDDKTLAVSMEITNDIRFFDVASEAAQPEKTIVTQGYISHVTYAADGARLFLPIVNPNTLLVVDPESGNTEVARRDFTPDECPSPSRVVLNGPSLLLVCTGDRKTNGRVLELDSVTLATIWSAEVGVAPSTIAVFGKSSP